ncbi:hypothetical protein CRYUN_Cryun10bG0072300 [Craigia yunnanensis]
MELHQLFLDMAVLVEAQGQQLNDIESHVAHDSSFVMRGTEQLDVAKGYQKTQGNGAALPLFLASFSSLLSYFRFYQPYLRTHRVMDGPYGKGLS